MTKRDGARVARALGASALAIASALATGAAAQCAPDPTQAGGTTTCSGTDGDGIRVTTPGTTVNVAAGAAVLGGGGAAITFDVPGGANVMDALNISGTVNGGSQPGVSLFSARTGYGSALLQLTVAQGATLTGASGLLMGRNPASNYYGSVFATVDNAGTITGSGGVALGVNMSNYGGFQSIINRSSGLIGAIAAPVGALTNAGTINGGARSAIDGGSTSLAGTGAWTNTGLVTSASSASTVANMAQTAAGFVNAGTVRNTGSGAALAGDFITLTNQAGGVISATGGTAINAGLQLNLINPGTINGNVIARTPSSTGWTSTIDSTRGIINGNVTLGANSDILIARYVGKPTLVTGITGTIDGGGGTNIVQLLLTNNTTINTGVTLPTTFSRLRLTPSSGVTVTLDPGFVPPGVIELTGTGSVLNRAAINTTGTVFNAPIGQANPISIINQGAITTSGGSAFDLSQAGTLHNNANITVSNGIGVGMSVSTALINTATITASAAGVSLFSTNLDNQGTIRSTGSFGVIASGSTGMTLTNSGRIDGASYGVILSNVALTNTGVITGGTAGIGLESYATVNNAAGATISGGRSMSAYGPLSNAVVANAGTLIGDVVFASPNGGSYNTYLALGGGVLNGNLALGNNGLLVTDLVNTGRGQFAGITGTVSATNGALRFRVGSDAAATLGPVGPFAIAGYELGNGAKLTLTAPTTQSQALLLAGTGSVDVNANFAVSGTPAIQSTAVVAVPGATVPATQLSITSRGTITTTRPSNANISNGGAVALSPGDSFTNAGTINVVDRNSFPYTYAVTGGASVTNSGAIRLDGGYGVSGATTLNNTGTITQVAGGATAQGVVNVGAVTNSGTINVGGAAVQLGYGTSTLTNSGLVASTGGAAVTGQNAYNGAVSNLAGGVIRGGAGTAAQLNGGTFTNAGTVTGTVDLGYYSYGRSYSGGAYIAAGGTVAGDVLFGNGDDLFLQTGATTGVSGVIDGQGGRNIYGRVFTSSGSMALDAVPVRNFQDRLIEALGADTVATATAGSAFTGNLYATGTGNIVNAATINGQLLASLPYSAQAAIPAAQNALVSLTNAGTVSGGVSGSVASFTNTGTIGAARLLAPAVSISNAGALLFSNSGQITANASSAARGNRSVVELSGTDNVSVVNSGGIQGVGGLLVPAQFTGAVTGAATVSNGGLITSTNGQPSLHVITSGSAGTGGGAGAQLNVTNTGTLASNGAYAYGPTLSLGGTGAALGYRFANSGAITATAASSSAVGLVVYGDTGVTGAVSNAAGGTITATAPRLAVGVYASGTPLVLDNAGSIFASGGTASVAVQATDPFANVIRNTGSITGDIMLGDGGNRVENAGTVTGNITFGAGDDMFVQRGGMVTGTVDGGAGANLLRVDSGGGGAVAGATFANFGRVQQVGSGGVAYSGAFTAPTIELAGGTLSVAAGQTLSTGGATTITGTGAGVAVVNAGTVAGGITLGDGGNSVSNSGAIGGPVLLGAGNDSFRTTSGATLGGAVDGGAGTNSLTLALSSDTMLTPGVFRNFQSLTTEGASTLALTGGAFSYDRVSAAGNLMVASDATLTAPVTFGAGDNRFSILGRFAGSVDGGAGNDTVEVSGGTQAAPVAFSSVSNVESYRQTAGFATLSGAGGVGAMYLGGGRFVGLSGSVLTASQISVDTGATFGSAGVVNGNVAVAGTLSPGASPGTMTVNGDVSLLGGSVSLFELTPAVSDKLVVNGAVGIAPGATLQLAPTGTGGGALDLVTATGGVSGAFSTLLKPASLNGFLSYQATRIQFVTAFTADASFSPQAARALGYANGVLTSGQASAALLASFPRLLTATGAASAAAFSRITPEPYATAQQIGVESGLALSDSARGAGFAAPTDRAGLFTFGELQGDWTRLPGSAATGASSARASAQGLLGGVGIGTGALSLGAFAGYRWTEQRIAALDARTRQDGTVAGVQARAAAGGFTLIATGAYDGGAAVTTRGVPDGTARARYGLHGWTGDLYASYSARLGANWLLQPNVGGTVIRDIRERAAETGGSGFALNVARGRERASFVDGGLGVEGGAAPGARIHPFLSLGARWQFEGREPVALAGFGGGATGLLAYGGRREKVVGTGTVGVAADVAPGLSLFASGTGEAAGAEHRIAARAGLRARF